MIKLVHIILPALMGSLCTLATIMQVSHFKVNDWDFSFYSQLPWAIANGRGYSVPFIENILPPFYTDHAAPLSALFAPVMYFFPSPYATAVLHGLAVSGCFFFLPILVKEIYKQQGSEKYLKAAMFLLCLLFLYLPFLAAWRYSVHMTTFATPFVFLALIFLHRKQLWKASLCCLVVALAQERATVAVVCIGLYAFCLLKLYRYGFGLCACATGYFVFLLKAFFPYVRSLEGLTTSYGYIGAVGLFVDMGTKGTYLAKQVLFAAFLPLAGRRALMAVLCAMPLLALNIISTRSSMYNFVHHYQDLSTPFFMASACYGLFWVHATFHDRFFIDNERKYSRCITFLMLIFLLVSSALSFQRSPIIAIRDIIFDKNFAELVLLRGDIKKIMALDSSIILYSQTGLGPQTTLRENRFALVKRTLDTKFSKSLVVLFSICGTFRLGDYDEAVRNLKNNPSLVLVQEKKRIHIFAAKDLDENKYATLVNVESTGY